MNDCKTDVRSCVSLPSERVLCSGVVTFPGVYDQLGCALVIFPAEFQNTLLCDVTKEEVVEFVFYCLQLHNKCREECLVSVVADLRDASVALVRRVAEILLLLQLHKRTVHSFYAIQPRKRDVHKVLQKLLSPSRHSPPLLQCVFLREVFELCKYVDRSQLTAHLGGYFIYSHESWVSFIREMDSFVQEFVAVVRKLPVCIGALHDFSKLSVPDTYESLAMFCSTNQARLELLRRELGLDTLLRRCERMLEKFRNPEQDPCYQAMVGTVLFTHTTLEMLQNYDRIRAAVEKVELLWKHVFSNPRLRLHVLQLQRDAGQVVCEIESSMQKMQYYKPELLQDADRAEDLRREFNTSVHTHAVVLLRRSEEVLNAVSEVAVFRQGRDGLEWLTELERWTEQLRALMESWSRNLNTICTFHHSYHKIQRWFHAAVSESFLQDLLWRTYDKHNPEEVFSVIKEFLRLHPPPERDELKQLAHLAIIVPDTYLENIGKQLAKRCTCLRKLLLSPGSVKFHDLQLFLQWQYEYLKGRNETSELLRNMSAQSMLGTSEGGRKSVNEKGSTRHDPLLFRSRVNLPSLSSFDSGFDGAGSGHPETGCGKTCNGEVSRSKVSEENVSSIYESLAEEKCQGAPNICIVPNAPVDSVNFEITVKRSATLPNNPWLSLPVDDLENCYTVIISPSQQGVTQCCNQLTQTTDTSVCDFQDQSADWSPVRNVLSSTITDGAETSETMPTLLWDSYDLRDHTESMLLAKPECDWERKEQQELRAVEETLNRAVGILQEEESVLAQEAILGVLLEEENSNRLWPSWSKVCQFTRMTSSDLAEAGVIGLEDDLSSLNFGYEDFSQSPSEQSSDPLHIKSGNGGPERSVLLKELAYLKVLEEKIVEEDLKICELCCHESVGIMSFGRQSKDRKRFLEELEHEKNEVDEMERNLSREMKQNKCMSRSHKVLTCSIMRKASGLRKVDEAVLINCRSSAMLDHGQLCLEESTNPQLLGKDEDNQVQPLRSDAINSKCPNVATDPLMNDLPTMDQQYLNSRASSASDAPPSVTGNGLCRYDPEMKDLESSVTNLSQVPVIGEPSPSDLLNDTEEKCMFLDSSETLDPSEPCNEEPKVGTLMSEEVLTPAFDPGGLPPFPHTSRLEELETADSNEPAAINQAAFSTLSLGSEPKELKSVPCRTSPAELNNQNVNNNLHLGDLHVGFSRENVPEEPEHINSAEDQKPEALGGRTQSYVDGALTRRVCKSPVHHQLQREMSDFQTPVVLDTGSGLVKAGFADQELPSTVFPTAVGLPKYEEVMSGSVARGVYVGNDAQYMRGVLTLHYPMRNGVVSNWDQMEMIWTHAFDQLRVRAADHPVLLTEGVLSTHEHRQRSIQLLFESFNVPFAYMAMQPVLALYTTGCTTGVVFDSGDGVSHSVPVFDGYCLPHAVQRFNLAGADVTLHLKQLLTEQGVCMRTSAEMEIVRKIKERCCYVALDYEVELSEGGRANTQMHYTLPDGHVVSLSMERFRAAEILFRPELIGQDYYGMHESIFKSILKSDIDLRRDLVEHIVLSGGNTLLPGLPERLQHEISRLAPTGLAERVKVTSPRARDFLVWRGGAVLASLPSFCSAWISQDEYEEFGPQIVFRKCF